MQAYFIEQCVSIDALADLFNRTIGVDRHPCRPIELGIRYSSTLLQAY